MDEWTYGPGEYPEVPDWTYGPGEYPEVNTPLPTPFSPEDDWTPANPTTAAGGGFDESKLIDLTNLLKTGGTTALSALKAIGLLKADGSLDMAALTALLGGFGTMLNTTNAQGKASEQLQQAAKDANTESRALVGGAIDQFAPWTTTGAKALPDLYNMATGPGLAAKFNSAGTPSNLSGKFGGAMTLQQLAKR